MRTLVVIPCFNEAARLDPAAFREFVDCEPLVDLLFVDDGSRDATRAILDRLGATRPERIQVLALSRNAGKAEAVRRGMLAALDHEPECIAFWDADLATPLETIVPFREILQRRPEVQVVIGARIALLGHRVQREAHRNLAGRVFARAASLVLGLPIHDTQCGAKMFRASPALRSLLAEPFSSRWIFDVELLARYLAQRRAAGCDPLEALYEFPLDEWRDVAGSKLRPTDAVRAIGDLTRICCQYRLTIARRARGPIRNTAFEPRITPRAAPLLRSSDRKAA